MSRAWAAQDGNIVARHGGVLRDQHKPIKLRLSHQHPIKWIIVVPRQPAGSNRVSGMDWQRLEPHALHHGVEPFQRELQPAKRSLDRDFPNRRGTHQNLVLGRGDRRASALIQAPRLRHCPDQDMRVEQ